MIDISKKIDELRRKIASDDESLLVDAIASRDLKKVKDLHEKGYDFNKPFLKRRQSSHALSFAIDSTDEIFSYILEHTKPEVVKKATVDTYDHPIPIIHRLARNNDKNKMEILLNTGVVNIDELDYRGYTPVADAAAFHSWETASFLIKRGADVTKKVEGKPIYEILASSKERFMKGNLYVNSYNAELLGKTGDSSNGKVSKTQKEIAKLQTDVAKTVMLAKQATKLKK